MPKHARAARADPKRAVGIRGFKKAGLEKTLFARKQIVHNSNDARDNFMALHTLL
jgi:hypothetical protein